MSEVSRRFDLARDCCALVAAQGRGDNAAARVLARELAAEEPAYALGVLTSLVLRALAMPAGIPGPLFAEASKVVFDRRQQGETAAEAAEDSDNEEEQ